MDVALRCPPLRRTAGRVARPCPAQVRCAPAARAPITAPMPLRLPPPLAPGARVALVSPAGPLRGAADVECAVATVQRLGWEPVVGRHVLDRHAYFAGRDEGRLADLNTAMADPAVDAIWCLRGGYGAMRLLPEVDWHALATRPCALIGFSDVTALLSGAATQAGVGGFHGPVARNPLTSFAERSFLAAVAGVEQPCGRWSGGRTLRPGDAEGYLAAGNLALLTALVGTPYFPELDGTILVLEDVNEATYRVDRMLRQLLLAGVLRGVCGIVVGQFTGCPEQADEDGARSIDDLFTELAGVLDVPCAAGAPVGHIDDQWTLPLGARAYFDADQQMLHVRRAAAS